MQHTRTPTHKNACGRNRVEKSARDTHERNERHGTNEMELMICANELNDSSEPSSCSFCESFHIVCRTVKLL